MIPSTEAAPRKEKRSLRRRGAGVLLHLSSLPGGHGVGDLGPEARRFVDFLAAGGQSWWQTLPIGPAGAGNSPYSSPSSFAGNPLLISLQLLVEDGLLEPEDLGPFPAADEARVGYEEALRFKEPRLRKAFARFAKGAPSEHWAAFKIFYAAHAGWADDYAFYCALQEQRKGPWTEWEPEIRGRRFRLWGRETLRGLGEAAAYHQFVQYLFERQWKALRAYAAGRGVGLIGDVPIFAAHQSADVWANQELFQLGEDGRPTVLAGVPPDYFSDTGQLWGNPHYRWDVLRSRGYDWWLARLRAAAERFDAVRLDHFIGFQNYWEIPAEARTAKEGRWVSGPGADFFERMTAELKGLELIAEDLGSVTPEVAALRDRFDLPGMRILQFAFGGDHQAESFLPRNYPRRCVAYTGTHDNDTTAGWFAGSSTPSERENALRTLKSDGKDIHWDMIRTLLGSTADTAIFPAQDLAGLGSEARMNRPGTERGNWEWRLKAGQLTDAIGSRLKKLTVEGGRS